MRNIGIVSPAAGGVKLLKYSAIAPYEPEFGFGESYIQKDSLAKGKRIFFRNISIASLYEKAYNFSVRPLTKNLPLIFETRSNQVGHEPKSDVDKDGWYSKNLFLYELATPDSSINNLGAFMILGRLQ